MFSDKKRRDIILNSLNKNSNSWTKRFNKSEFWQKHVIDPEHADKIINIIKVLAKFPYNFSINFSYVYFDEDGWNISDFDIIIHYPEFTITNKYNKSHQIKDLYVKFEVLCNPEGKFLIGSLYGIRTTSTPLEISFNYMHSHLSSARNSMSKGINSLVQWHKFCVGYAEMEKARMSLNTKFSIDTFELFLYSIESFIKWESLDGGPYRKIGEMDYKQKNINSFWDYKSAKLIFEKHILEANKLNALRDVIRLENNIPVMVIDESLCSSLLNILPEITYVGRNDNNNDVYGTRETPEEVEMEVELKRLEDNSPLLYFRSEPIFFKLGDWTKGQEETRGKRYISRNFLQTLKRIVDDKLKRNWYLSEIVHQVSK